MIRKLCLLSALLSASLALPGCDQSEPGVQYFDPAAYPERLSQWHLLKMTEDALVFSAEAVIYDLNTPLFSDYAQKLRTVWLPNGQSAEYADYEAFDFPVGTIISKTFFYPETAETGFVKTSYEWPKSGNSLPVLGLNILETRLLVKQADGWDALPYVWRGDDAYLKIAGDYIPLKVDHETGVVEDLAYIVPTRNECAACHATNHSTGELLPIGLKARHLNREFRSASNQLSHWQQLGILRGVPEDPPALTRWNDTAATLEDRARAYLDVNCGHCHNANGAADTSGLFLDSATTSMRELGTCKPPIAAGGGSGGHQYSIVPGRPDESILVFRMATSDPATRMPELGRSLVHLAATNLLTDWIVSLPGECIEG